MKLFRTISLALFVTLFAALAFAQSAPQMSVFIYPTGDLCQNPNVVKSSAVVNISTATTTELVAASAGKKVYLCSFHTSTGGTTPTIQFKYGTKTTTACDTGATNLSGAFAPPSATMFSLTGASGTLLSTPAANELCATTGGTSPAFIGVVVYVQR